MIDIRRGMVLNMNGTLFYCLDRDLNTPGNWRAILYLKLKNLTTGSITDERVHPDDKVDVVYLDTKDYNYSYKDGDDFVFVDAETFEPVNLNAAMVGDMMKYLRENDPCKITFYDGKALSMELPADRDAEGGRDGTGHQGRDRRGPDQARDPGDGAGRSGAVVHRRGRTDRHPDGRREIPETGREGREIAASRFQIDD